MTLEQIKAYQPENKSLCSGQVLQCPYDVQKARLIVWEMTDLLVLDLVEKGLVTDQIVLTVGYDIENLSDPARQNRYQGEVTTDHYGRKVPKAAHGTASLGRFTSSTKQITDAVMALYDRIVNPALLIRRVTLSADHLTGEAAAKETPSYEQLELFADYEALGEKQAAEDARLAKERKLQEAVLCVKKKYGKNAILRGVNLQEGAMARERNKQIGGHKA